MNSEIKIYTRKKTNKNYVEAQLWPKKASLQSFA